MADYWAPKVVLDDGEAPLLARARRWYTVVYALFSWFGLFVGFVAFEAVTSDSALTAFRSLYAGQELFSVWVLIACGLVMAFASALIAQLGQIVWLLVVRFHLGLSAAQVSALGDPLTSGFVFGRSYRCIYGIREP